MTRSTNKSRSVRKSVVCQEQPGRLLGGMPCVCFFFAWTQHQLANCVTPTSQGSPRRLQNGRGYSGSPPATNQAAEARGRSLRQRAQFCQPCLSSPWRPSHGLHREVSANPQGYIAGPHSLSTPAQTVCLCLALLFPGQNTDEPRCPVQTPSLRATHACCG